VSATTTSGQTATATATAVSYGASVAWDAASQNTFTVRPGSLPSADQQVAWKKRKVFFSDATGQVQQIKVNNDSQGSIDTGTRMPFLPWGWGIPGRDRAHRAVDAGQDRSHRQRP